MKIHILYPFRDGPWGGGNQFLKNLKQFLVKSHHYEESAEKANVILYNSYPFGHEYLFGKLFTIKQNYPEKIVIYRIDGPISSIRGEDRIVDTIISRFNHLLADGIVFQSYWSEHHNRRFDLTSVYEQIIFNAADDTVFNRKGKSPFRQSGKIKLMATSWSANWLKGFDIYQYLDEHLDFDMFEFTFAGNTPICFKNIKVIDPAPSAELAQLLKQHDIYITASRNDPCSNSLIEALSCGLPAVVLNDGGHPEIIKGGGTTFAGKEDILQSINRMAENYEQYQQSIPDYSLQVIGQQYVDFCQRVCTDFQKGTYTPKRATLRRKLDFVSIQALIRLWKLQNKTKRITGGLWKT